MADKTTLQTDFDLLSQRCTEKATELRATRESQMALIADLVDAAPKARPALLARRAEIANVTDSLTEELEVLIHRRDAAHVAIFELALSRAEENVTLYSQRSTAARHALDALLTEQHKFVNKGRGTMAEAESDKLRTELAVKIAQAQGGSAVLRRDTNRAAAARDKAKEALEALRKELGIAE